MGTKRLKHVVVLALGLVALQARIPVIVGQGKVYIGPNVQVSKANADRSHFETWIAADPSNPKRLLGGSMTAPSEPSQTWFDVIFYASFDGGSTWEPTYEQRAGQNADPVCAYDPNGDAYCAALGIDDFSKVLEGKLFIYRSNDGGKTWEKPLSFPFADRPYIAIDASGGKYNGQIYLNAVRGVETLQAAKYTHGIKLATSRDRGATFQWTSYIDTEPSHSHSNGNGVVLSDGTYVAVFSTENEAPRVTWATNPPTGEIWAVMSTDGGESLSKSVKVSDWYSGAVDHSYLIGSTTPILAVDESHGPFRDRLYVVWSDIQSGRAQVLLSYSSDKGKSWSRPTTVTDDQTRPNPGSGPHDSNPTIAVNKNGVVGVAWLDRRDDPNDYGYYQRFAASWDGGETFGPSVRISDKPATFGQTRDTLWAQARSTAGQAGVIDATIGYGNFTMMGGHTLGMAADADGGFHPFWVDNRTGVSQVWTARVTVAGTAVKNGDARFANFQDVTSKVALELFHPIYDVQKKMVTLDAYLENISASVLRAPLIARVLWLNSGLGIPVIVSGDNAGGSEAIILDFSKSLEGDSLKPGQRTSAKRLEFHLENARWPSGVSGLPPLTQLIQMRVKVLAAPPNP